MRHQSRLSAVLPLADIKTDTSTPIATTSSDRGRAADHHQADHELSRPVAGPSVPLPRTPHNETAGTPRAVDRPTACTRTSTTALQRRIYAPYGTPGMSA